VSGPGRNVPAPVGRPSNQGGGNQHSSIGNNVTGGSFQSSSDAGMKEEVTSEDVKDFGNGGSQIVKWERPAPGCGSGRRNSGGGGDVICLSDEETEVRGVVGGQGGRSLGSQDGRAVGGQDGRSVRYPTPFNSSAPMDLQGIMQRAISQAQLGNQSGGGHHQQTGEELREEGGGSLNDVKPVVGSVMHWEESSQLVCTPRKQQMGAAFGTGGKMMTGSPSVMSHSNSSFSNQLHPVNRLSTSC